MDERGKEGKRHSTQAVVVVALFQQNPASFGNHAKPVHLHNQTLNPPALPLHNYLLDSSFTPFFFHSYFKSTSIHAHLNAHK